MSTYWVRLVSNSNEMFFPSHVLLLRTQKIANRLILAKIMCPQHPTLRAHYCSTDEHCCITLHTKGIDIVERCPRTKPQFHI